ncbi:hypothetical protein JKP88DRAFT_255898, partial [Tribonema minus]
LIAGAVVAAYLCNGQGVTVTVAACVFSTLRWGNVTISICSDHQAIVATAICMSVRKCWQPGPENGHGELSTNSQMTRAAANIKLTLRGIAHKFCASTLPRRAAYGAMWLEPGRCYGVVGLLASTIYLIFHQGRERIVATKMLMIIAIFMHSMTCLSPVGGALKSARGVRIILDTASIIYFSLLLRVYRPEPSSPALLPTTTSGVPHELAHVVQQVMHVYSTEPEGLCIHKRRNREVVATNACRFVL